jgi:predicted enzyme related to lactoylglutathione lyase
MTPHGRFHWNELNTRDADAAKRFLEATLGWTFESMPMPNGTYWVASAGDNAVAGIFDTKAVPGPAIPEHWLPYISVDDIDARCRKAKEAGATIIREPFDVPGVGRIAILKQPGGAIVGWMTPAS